MNNSFRKVLCQVYDIHPIYEDGDDDLLNDELSRMNDELLKDSFSMGGGKIKAVLTDDDYRISLQDLNLEELFTKVHEIEKESDKLLKKLRNAPEEPKVVTKALAVKGIKEQMEKDVHEVGKIAHAMKTMIEQLDKKNLANRQKPRCGKGSDVDRSRMATTGAFKKKLNAKMSEFLVWKVDIFSCFICRSQQVLDTQEAKIKDDIEDLKKRLFDLKSAAFRLFKYWLQEELFRRFEMLHEQFLQSAQQLRQEG